MTNLTWANVGRCRTRLGVRREELSATIYPNRDSAPASSRLHCGDPLHMLHNTQYTHCHIGAAATDHNSYKSPITISREQINNRKVEAGYFHDADIHGRSSLARAICQRSNSISESSAAGQAAYFRDLAFYTACQPENELFHIVMGGSRHFWGAAGHQILPDVYFFCRNAPADTMNHDHSLQNIIV